MLSLFLLHIANLHIYLPGLLVNNTHSAVRIYTRYNVYLSFMRS